MAKSDCQRHEPIDIYRNTQLTRYQWMAVDFNENIIFVCTQSTRRAAPALSTPSREDSSGTATAATWKVALTSQATRSARLNRICWPTPSAGIPIVTSGVLVAISVRQCTRRGSCFRARVKCISDCAPLDDASSLNFR